MMAQELEKVFPFIGIAKRKHEEGFIRLIYKILMEQWKGQTRVNDIKDFCETLYFANSVKFYYKNDPLFNRKGFFSKIKKLVLNCTIQPIKSLRAVRKFEDMYKINFKDIMDTYFDMSQRSNIRSAQEIDSWIGLADNIANEYHFKIEIPLLKQVYRGQLNKVQCIRDWTLREDIWLVENIINFGCKWTKISQQRFRYENNNVATPRKHYEFKNRFKSIIKHVHKNYSISFNIKDSPPQFKSLLNILKTELKVNLDTDNHNHSQIIQQQQQQQQIELEIEQPAQQQEQPIQQEERVVDESYEYQNYEQCESNDLQILYQALNVEL